MYEKMKMSSFLDLTFGLFAIFGVKTRDFEEKSLKTGNFTCSLYFAEYYQFL
jgi:hypothetical protein